MKKLTTFSEANQQTGGQETIFPDKLWDNYPYKQISKQSAQGETSFLERFQRIHRGSKARKLKK